MEVKHKFTHFEVNLSRKLYESACVELESAVANVSVHSEPKTGFRMLNTKAGRDRFDLPSRWQNGGTPFCLLEATKLERKTIGWCWIVVAMTVVAVWVPKTVAG